MLRIKHAGRLPVRSLHRQALTLRQRRVRRAAYAQNSQGRPELEGILQNMRKAIACTDDDKLQEASVSGIGRHLGINISWHIHFRSDGAFVEEINGKVLNFLWGFDGRPDSSCWEGSMCPTCLSAIKRPVPKCLTSGVARSLQLDHEEVLIIMLHTHPAQMVFCTQVDTSGVSRSLQFDDHEAVLISTWVRTGTWLRPGITERLELELERPQGQRQSPESSSLSVWQVQQQKEQLGSNSSSSSSSSSLSSTPPLFTDLAEPGPREASIRVKLKGGRLVNTMRICTDSWVVLSLQQPQCGDLEVWHFGAWKPWTDDMRVFFPSDLIHQAAGGGRHVYKVQECSTRPRVLASGYQKPIMPLLPNDTTYDGSISDTVPVWRSFSGHLLVRPHINGKDSGGYMILDTGASGFVITHNAAVNLGLASFGELFAASISGKVQTQFVRANTWSLGPLTICQPVMMTMVLDGLVRGGPTDGDLIGIIGYDVFRRAVVQLPQMCDSGVIEPLLEDECTEAEHATALQASSTSAGEPQATAGGGDGGGQFASKSSTSTSAPQGRAAESSSSNSGSSCSSGGSSSSNLEGNSTKGLRESGNLSQSPEHLHSQAAGAGPGNCGNGSSSSGSSSSSNSSSSNSGGEGKEASCHSSSSSSGLARERQASSAHASTSSSTNSGISPANSTANSTANIGINSNSTHGGSRGIAGGSKTQSRRSASRTKRRRSPSPAPGFAKKGCPEYTMRLWEPGSFPEECAREWQWHPISMISNLPHIEVSFMNGSNSSAKALLMLDTGACGADIMLHARAIDELQLGELGRATTQYMRGVGGTNNTRVDVADLPWIELAGVRCHKVRCLYARGISGLDISIYSAGIIGGDLMSRFEFIVDYARRRLGVRKRFLREADAVQ